MALAAKKITGIGMWQRPSAADEPAPERPVFIGHLRQPSGQDASFVTARLEIYLHSSVHRACSIWRTHKPAAADLHGKRPNGRPHKRTAAHDSNIDDSNVRSPIAPYPSVRLHPDAAWHEADETEQCQCHADPQRGPQTVAGEDADAAEPGACGKADVDD